MHVQVRDGLAAMRAIVDHDAKALREIELAGHGRSGQQQVAEEGLVVCIRFSNTREVGLGNHKQVHRRLRLDVVDDNAVLVLVLNPRGDFPVDDALKNRLGHASGIGMPRHVEDKHLGGRIAIELEFLLLGEGSGIARREGVPVG